MRLDTYLSEKGLVASRERAKRLIQSGLVTVNGLVVTKPSADIVGEAEISLQDSPFVGRGGEKLEGALSLFGVNPEGLRVLDVGASTGGFTHCLLMHGAAHVVALDVGVGQLHPSLLSDGRVTNLEKYNARALSRSDVGVFPLVVMDVSFISQTHILERFPDVMTEDGMAITLIKPQFEAGRDALNKKGVVKDAKKRLAAIFAVRERARELGLYLRDFAPSPITGSDGNREYLALFSRSDEVIYPVSKITQTVLEGR